MAKKIVAFMDGKKTYTVVGIAIVYAVAGLIGGYLDQETATLVILNALGIAGVRDAIN